MYISLSLLLLFYVNEIPPRFIFVDDGIQTEELLPEDVPSPNSSEMPEDSDDFWKKFMESTSPVDSLVRDKDNTVAQEKARSEEVDSDNQDGDDDSLEKGSEPKSSKRHKRNKWKPEEVKELIKFRGALHNEFKVAKGRMALWKAISTDLISEGFDRSPGQCKSLWTSLLQKYEVFPAFSLMF